VNIAETRDITDERTTSPMESMLGLLTGVKTGFSSLICLAEHFAE
jgi:hypothetical protein